MIFLQNLWNASKRGFDLLALLVCIVGPWNKTSLQKWDPVDQNWGRAAILKTFILTLFVVIRDVERWKVGNIFPKKLLTFWTCEISPISLSLMRSSSLFILYLSSKEVFPFNYVGTITKFTSCTTLKLFAFIIMSWNTVKNMVLRIFTNNLILFELTLYDVLAGANFCFGVLHLDSHLVKTNLKYSFRWINFNLRKL